MKFKSDFIDTLAAIGRLPKGNADFEEEQARMKVELREQTHELRESKQKILRMTEEIRKKESELETCVSESYQLRMKKNQQLLEKDKEL